MAELRAMQEAIAAMATAMTQFARHQTRGDTATAHGLPAFPRYAEGEDIQDFCSQFEGLATVHAYDEAKRKASFLALLPISLYQLLKNLVFPEDIAECSYEQLKQALIGHLRPAPLRIPSRHALCSRRQREGESIADYLTALRALAIPCGYGADTLTEVLKDIFVAGIRSKSILDQLFAMPDDATLTQLYQKAVAIEKAEASTVQVLTESKLSPVNKVTHRPKSNSSGKGPPQKSQGDSSSSSSANAPSQKIVCFSCGKPSHKRPDCPADRESLHCTVCDKTGHVKSVCRSGKDKPPSSRRRRSDKSRVNRVDVRNTNVSDPWVASVHINNTPMELELDTGCEYTIIPQSVFSKLRVPAVLKPTNKIFQPYGEARPMAALGAATVSVRYRAFKDIQLELYVVRENATPIMGRHWLRALSIYDPPPAVHSIKEVRHHNIADLMTEFSSVFADGIGCAPTKISLQFKADSKPVFRKHRSVAYALRDKVAGELDRLVKEGVLVPVDHSEWATPIVPVVKGDSVRITADYSGTVNPNLLIPTYPLPRIEEQLSNVANGKVFCKLDLRKAYLCLPLDERSASALTINTHKGLFKPTRLMFGCASAPVIWAKFIEQVVTGIEGLSAYFDDILIAAQDEQTLKARLREVLRRLQDNGLRLNVDKCAFFVTKVSYLGHELTPQGIRPASEGVAALRALPTPKNAEELRKFLGMVSFYSKFFSGMAETAAPLYDATRRNIPFKWTTACASAFNKLKQELTSDRVLVPYDPTLPVVLSCDAGPRGLGAVLAHTYPDGSERPIVYIHKKLDNCQVKYSQIDKEALAIKWAVEKLHPYLIARHFTLVTDHAPLVHIFGPRRKKLPPLCATRLLHYALFLQDFNFSIIYRKSQLHGNADFLSRLPQHSSGLQQADVTADPVDIVQLHHISILPLSQQSIAKYTLRDALGREWLQKLRSGESLGEKDDGLYSLQSGCIMRGLRTYIPVPCRKAVLDELHAGHLGISKMKALARSYVFWPNMDSDVENLCKNCRACALHKGRATQVETHYWEHPKKIWERIHADFAFYGKHIYFIVVDAHSKWPEISIVPNMLASTVISKLSELFARYGLPACFVTDNQSTFVGREVREFLKERNIMHRTIAPYHSATNGLAERMVSALKTCLRTLQYSRGNAHDNLLTFLVAYRRAPHSTTGVSPAMLFLKRELHTPLSFCQSTQSPIIEERAQRSSEHQDPCFKDGEKVAVRDFGNPLHKWKFGTVIARDGQLGYTVLMDGELHRKHIEQLRRVGQDVQVPATVPFQATPLPLPTPVVPASPARTPQPPSPTRVRSSEMAPVSETPRTDPSSRQVPTFTVPTTPPLAQRREPRVRRPVVRFSPA